LKEADKLRSRAELDVIEFPPLPANLAKMLESTLEDVSRGAEEAVKKHLASHHAEGNESWLSDGIEFMEGDTCPFCGQSTKGVDLIDSYRMFFNAEYQQFRGRITRYKANSEQLLSDDRIDLALSRFAGNQSNAEVWAQYVSIKPPTLDERVNIKEAMTTFRDIVLDLCAKKVASPLDRVAIPASYHTAYSRFGTAKGMVDDYNEQVKAANVLIAEYKKNATIAQTQSAERQLAGLRLIKKRHEPEIATACALYKKLTREREELDKQKVVAREALDKYSTDVLARYKTAINANLRKFNAGFHIDQVKVEYTGRIPNSTFCVVINDMPIDMGTADTPLNQPSFKNTLSAGDRSTLALAFFMTELAEDSHKAETIVVFDDPFNSQDHYRRTCTITEIRRCGNGVAQVVVMSHDRHFLREIWDLPLPPDERKTLELVAVGKRDTIIAPWDIENDTESDDAANRRILNAFHTKREGSPRDVIQKIRPVIETHIRRIAPREMEGASTLGAMLGRIRDDDKVPPALKSAYDDIDDVNTYTRQFMHGDPHYSEGKRLSADELAGFIEKVLLIVGH
jgi:wobble nucleotide-excising tRNase